jgi:hypothetical protein
MSNFQLVNFIYAQGTRVSEDQEFREEFYLENLESSWCDSIEVPIVIYKGSSLDPRWMDTEAGTVNR